MLKTKRIARRTAALEICPSRLHLVIAQHRSDQEVQITTASQLWRQQSQWLHSEQGRKELTAALKQLVSEHKLHGVPTHLALSGEHCVTRVVTGTGERVRHELAQIEERSARYLSLGHGPKTMGGSVRQIDARHEHALLTVVNRRTIDAIVSVCAAARIDLQTVEPSLVALARLVGHLHGDEDAPALVVNLGERGVELGISHRGQLLLDYRPASWNDASQLSVLVNKHLTRLQRYCDRYVRFAEGKLKKVYLFGAADVLELAARGFQDQKALTVESLSLIPREATWNFAAPPANDVAASLGTCLLGSWCSTVYSGPNLTERVRLQKTHVSGSMLARVLMPAAALLLVTAGLAAMGAWGKVRCRVLEGQLARYETQQRRVQLLQRQIVRDIDKSKQLTLVYDKLLNPQWHELATTIGRCLPDDVWLDAVSSDTKGRLTLTGGSFTDLGIVEFVDWLRKFPSLEHVALNGTRSERMATGPAVTFDVYCEVTGHADQEGDNGKSS